MITHPLAAAESAVSLVNWVHFTDNCLFLQFVRTRHAGLDLAADFQCVTFFDERY